SGGWSGVHRADPVQHPSSHCAQAQAGDNGRRRIHCAPCGGLIRVTTASAPCCTSGAFCMGITMSTQLSVSLGQHSAKGCKPVNQDFCAACVPAEPQLGSKGVVVALADGISSSDVSHIASETAVANFIGDYYCTSDAWSVKKSATRVIQAAN